MLEQSADVMRQYIDAVATFESLEETRRAAAQVRGGMYWHKGPAGAPHQAYLIRTSATGSERSLGPRSLETEAIHEKFHHKKTELELRLAALQKALARHQRLNRALHVGRVLPLIVDILNRLANTQLADHFRIVGTHALYAYEAAAGVCLDPDTVATRGRRARRLPGSCGLPGFAQVRPH
ncbi:MAG: GSU2403 family nucleotidyltransferase fold protein [Janthinobacterium lividum]